MFRTLKIWLNQGKQYIPDVTTAEVPGIFRGRPVISKKKVAGEELLAELCPTRAIGEAPFSIDIGKCTFCGECALASPEKISFTKDYRLSAVSREDLIIREGEERLLIPDPAKIRKEIRKVFRNSLKLRQVSAAGDNSCEWELNAAGNVNFDIGRFGIEFVASPRHADGIVITGPVSENMAEPLQICYDAIPKPKIVILAGTDAISGGIFAGSQALDRSFLEKKHVDLYIAGNPVHPLTFINGVLGLTRGRNSKI